MISSKIKNFFYIIFLTSLVFLFLIIFGSVIRNIEHSFFKNISSEIKFFVDFPAYFYRTYIKKFETRDRYVPNSLKNKMFDPNVLSSKVVIADINKVSKKTNIKIYKPNHEVISFTLDYLGIEFINTDDKWFYQYSDNILRKISYKETNHKVLWEIKNLNLHHEFYVDKFFNISSPQFFRLNKNDKNIHPYVFKYENILKKAKAPLYLTGEIFNEDGVITISPEGRIIDNFGLTEIFINNNLINLLHSGTIEVDPYHLNSAFLIDKDYHDGFIQKGDIILSLRHKSMIMIYRPSSKKIIWYKIGPWFNQHSAKINDNGEIYLFNNNVYDTPYTRSSETEFFATDEKSLINKYSFDTHLVSKYNNCQVPTDIYSVTGGRVWLKDNLLISFYNNTGGITMFCDLKKSNITYLLPKNDGNVIYDLTSRRYLLSN